MNTKFLSVVKNFTRLFRKSLYQNLFYTLIVLGFCACHLNSNFLLWFTVTPLGFIHQMRIWSLFTFWVFEPNPLLLVNHALCVHLTFTVILTSWQMKELVKFFAIINISTALGCCVIFTLVYVCTGLEEVFYSNFRSVRGLVGFDAAVLVAVVQNMPDTVILHTPLGKFKNSNVPFTWLIFAVIFTIFSQNLLNFVYVPMFCCGFFTAWCYLRFYQAHSNGTQGDSSSCFSLSSFFPSLLKPCVESCGKCCYQSLVRLKICKPAIRTFDVKSLQAATTTVPILDSLDNERRKQKALKDLNDRLAKSKEATLTPWDEEANICSSISEIPQQSFQPEISDSVAKLHSAAVRVSASPVKEQQAN